MDRLQQRHRRTQEQLIRVDAPDLRILSEELWQQVRNRLMAKQEIYSKSSGQERNRNSPRGPALRDIESPYLLSGMARCGHCGGPIEALGRDYSRRKGRYYGCAYHRKRGTAICRNSLRVEQNMVDQGVLKALSEVLDERLLEAAVQSALETLRSGQDERLTRERAVERELSLIEAHESNLVDAIARGENMEPLLARLRLEECRKKELVVELDSLTKPAQIVDLDKARLKRNLLDRVADAKSLLRRHTTQARQILRKLLEKPLICEVIEEGGKKGFRVTGQGSYLHLIPESLASPFVVSPTGFEPVLLP